MNEPEVDINKLIQFAASGEDPLQEVRASEIAAWSESKASSLARADGIELTDDHIKAIKLLQSMYVARGPAPHARMVAGALADAFAAEGGSKFLYQLFPGGPVAQGSRLAGVPAPHDTKDLSFGSTF